MTGKGLNKHSIHLTQQYRLVQPDHFDAWTPSPCFTFSTSIRHLWLKLTALQIPHLIDKFKGWSTFMKVLCFSHPSVYDLPLKPNYSHRKDESSHQMVKEKLWEKFKLNESAGWMKTDGGWGVNGLHHKAGLLPWKEREAALVWQCPFKPAWQQKSSTLSVRWSQLRI